MLKKLLCLVALCLTVPLSQTAGAQPLKVCAVPQLYQALERIKESSPVQLELTYAPSTALYARVVNSAKTECEVLLSADERLPITLIRAQKLEASSLKAFTRAQLILWSPDRRRFSGVKNGLTDALSRVRSLAVPKPGLTPAGYAASLILARPDFPRRLLNSSIYPAEQEYQVYSMVKSGNVEAGIITRPLIASITRQAHGSFLVLPRSWYPDLLYYTSIAAGLDAAQQAAASRLVLYLQQDSTVQSILEACGFASLRPDNMELWDTKN